jgi:transcriptional regulator with XRE-family HTH domain
MTVDNCYVQRNSVRMLNNYLEQNGISHAEFARRIGLTRQSVWRICNGKQGVSLELAAHIEHATNGAVPMQSWVAPSAPAGDPPPTAPAGEGEAA